MCDVIDLLRSFVYEPSTEIICEYMRCYSDKKNRDVSYIELALREFSEIMCSEGEFGKVEYDKKVRRYTYFLILDLTFICRNCNFAIISCKDLAYIECAVISSLRLLSDSYLEYKDPLFGFEDFQTLPQIYFPYILSFDTIHMYNLLPHFFIEIVFIPIFDRISNILFYHIKILRDLCVTNDLFQEHYLRKYNELLHEIIHNEKKILILRKVELVTVFLRIFGIIFRTTEQFFRILHCIPNIKYPYEFYYQVLQSIDMYCKGGFQNIQIHKYFFSLERLCFSDIIRLIIANDRYVLLLSQAIDFFALYKTMPDNIWKLRFLEIVMDNGYTNSTNEKGIHMILDTARSLGPDCGSDRIGYFASLIQRYNDPIVITILYDYLDSGAIQNIIRNTKFSESVIETKYELEMASKPEYLILSSKLWRKPSSPNFTSAEDFEGYSISQRLYILSNKLANYEINNIHIDVSYNFTYEHTYELEYSKIILDYRRSIGTDTIEDAKVSLILSSMYNDFEHANHLVEWYFRDNHICDTDFVSHFISKSDPIFFNKSDKIFECLELSNDNILNFMTIVSGEKVEKFISTFCQEKELFAQRARETMSNLLHYCESIADFQSRMEAFLSLLSVNEENTKFIYNIITSIHPYLINESILKKSMKFILEYPDLLISDLEGITRYTISKSSKILREILIEDESFLNNLFTENFINDASIFDHIKDKYTAIYTFDSMTMHREVKGCYTISCKERESYNDVAFSSVLLHYQPEGDFVLEFPDLLIIHLFNISLSMVKFDDIKTFECFRTRKKYTYKFGYHDVDELTHIIYYYRDNVSFIEKYKQYRESGHHIPKHFQIVSLLEKMPECSDFVYKPEFVSYLESLLGDSGKSNILHIVKPFFRNNALSHLNNAKTILGKLTDNLCSNTDAESALRIIDFLEYYFAIYPMDIETDLRTNTKKLLRCLKGKENPIPFIRLLRINCMVDNVSSATFLKYYNLDSILFIYESKSADIEIEISKLISDAGIGSLKYSEKDQSRDAGPEEGYPESVMQMYFFAIEKFTSFQAQRNVILAFLRDEVRMKDGFGSTFSEPYCLLNVIKNIPQNSSTEFIFLFLKALKDNKVQQGSIDHVRTSYLNLWKSRYACRANLISVESLFTTIIRDLRDPDLLSGFFSPQNSTLQDRDCLFRRVAHLMSS